MLVHAEILIDDKVAARLDDLINHMVEAIKLDLDESLDKGVVPTKALAEAMRDVDDILSKPALAQTVCRANVRTDVEYRLRGYLGLI